MEYSDNYSMTSEISGVIIEMKWMMMQIEKMMQIIIELITARQEQVTCLSIRET